VGFSLVYRKSMLEEAIARLTAEIERLREVLERQNAMLATERATNSGRARLDAGASSPTAPEANRMYLNDRAVAELAGWSVATVRRWRFFRKGPPYRKFGSAVRYLRTEVLTWLHGRRVE
jgi:predicted DNA-binding transcriptional regulator AlpA